MEIIKLKKSDNIRLAKKENCSTSTNIRASLHHKLCETRTEQVISPLNESDSGASTSAEQCLLINFNILSSRKKISEICSVVKM